MRPRLFCPAFLSGGGMAAEPGSIRRGVVALIRLPRDKARPAAGACSDLLAESSHAMAVVLGIGASGPRRTGSGATGIARRG